MTDKFWESRWQNNSGLCNKRNSISCLCLSWSIT